MIKPRKSLPESFPPVRALEDCIAKTRTVGDAHVTRGATVKTHCLLAGLVARELSRRYPQCLKALIFPSGFELQVAVHDVGKISPTFQEKIYRKLRCAEFPQGCTLGLTNPELDKLIGYHFAVSQAALQPYDRVVAAIAGRHHGSSPLAVDNPLSEKYGGPHWQELRSGLVELLQRELQVEFPQNLSSTQADILSGLTCVADWIASSEQFDAIEESGDWPRLIEQAVCNAGFIKPSIVRGLSFEQIFGFAPKEVQTQLFSIAHKPGVYILEAPMGIGKTGAALYCAYRLLEQEVASGIYFALPTQLTSNKIYERFNLFLEKIVPLNCAQGPSLLVHGNARLYTLDLGADAEPGHAWFNHNKRGLLAPFAVGTIDQALMAVMNVDHGFVRTFGLAGKVVILDEVHSYDTYTGTILDSLVNALEQSGCTVLILTATLTAQRRGVLLNSPQRSPVLGYPLIAERTALDTARVYVQNSLPDKEVVVKLVREDDTALEEALLRAEQGQQVLWIENSVQQAQDLFARIGARAAGVQVECGLVHSRFLQSDRQKNENYWVTLFGKGATEQRMRTGRILVGTQVLEQSLDIDADFLITRLCPSDMIVQRIGRLWRHEANDSVRPFSARREVWLLGPSLTEVLAGEAWLGTSAKVYAAYVLLRTMEVWESVSRMALPADIPMLIERTYEERDPEPHATFERYKQEMKKECDRLRQFANIGIARGGKTISDVNATTRYAELESRDVLLLRALRSKDGAVHIRMLDGEELLLHSVPRRGDRGLWRRTAARLQMNLVAVPKHLAPSTSLKQYEWLTHYVYTGRHDEDPLVRVALVEDSGMLRDFDGGAALEGYRLRYSPQKGYQAEKIH